MIPYILLSIFSGAVLGSLTVYLLISGDRIASVSALLRKDLTKDLEHQRQRAQSLCSQYDQTLQQLQGLQELRISLEKENSTLTEKSRLYERQQIDYEKLQQRNLKLEKLLNDISVRRESEQKLYRQKFQLLEESREQLSKEFENISRGILDTTTERMQVKNNEHMRQLLDPLQNQISQFRERVDRVYDSEAKDRRSLYDEILHLKDLNTRLHTEAENLTKALKGDTKKQGAWGELVLERLLEQSGLRKGEEYETQSSYLDEDGRMKRPDVIVHMPDARDVIVDAKVSLTAYERYVSSDTEEQRGRELAKHLTSLRAHVTELSEKNYDEIRNLHTLDFVLMFVPIESAFMTAIESDRALFHQAYEKNIIIVSPSTLLVTLRTIGNIWRYERQSANSREIAAKAGKLYDKFVLFLESLEDIDRSLIRTRKAYDTAVQRLSLGRGNLISQAEQIRTLGAQTKKRLPESFTDSTDAG